MGRPALGPRLWQDATSGKWIIRDGSKFIRTGATGWANAQEKLLAYLKTKTGKPAFIKKAPPGIIYFMTASHPEFPIKIGFTEKRNSLRLQSLQTGCPYALVVLAEIAGTYQEEKGLHRMFASSRLSGEWFQRTPELLALIQSYCQETASMTSRYSRGDADAIAEVMTKRAAARSA